MFLAFLLLLVADTTAAVSIHYVNSIQWIFFGKPFFSSSSRFSLRFAVFISLLFLLLGNGAWQFPRKNIFLFVHFLWFPVCAMRFEQSERNLCFLFQILLFTDSTVSLFLLWLHPVSCRCRGNCKTEWEIALKRYLSNDATHSKFTRTHSRTHTDTIGNTNSNAI